MIGCKIAKDALQRGLARIQGIINPRSPMPILANVLLSTEEDGFLVLVGTDIDHFLEGRYESEILSAGSVCLPAKELFEIVKNMPQGDIQLEQTEDHTVAISSGKIEFKLRAFPATDFPVLPPSGEVGYTRVTREAFLQMISRTLFSVAMDDPRIFLTGINFERLDEKKFRMVSTDGHRLSLCDGEFAEDMEMEKKVILPRKGMTELKKLLEEDDEDIDFGIKGSSAFVAKKNLLFIMRLIEGEYPDYTMVIPHEPNVFIDLDKLVFANALRRVSLMSAQRSQGVKLTFLPGMIEITSQDPERGFAKETLVVDYDGEEIEIGFNAKYFMEALNNIEGEQAVLKLSGKLAPCIVTAKDNEEYFFVIMPVRF